MLRKFVASVVYVTLSFLLFMAENEVYQACYQSTLLAALKQRCRYSSDTDCR